MVISGAIKIVVVSATLVVMIVVLIIVPVVVIKINESQFRFLIIFSTVRKQNSFSNAL